MLVDLPWLKYSEDIELELLEAEEEGKLVEKWKGTVAEIKTMQSGAAKELLAGSVFDDLELAPVKAGYPYIEPSHEAGIQANRPRSKVCPEAMANQLSRGTRYQKIYGAWLGRCAGCLLGQPVEGWKRSRIINLLKATDNYPIKYYLSSDIPEAVKAEYEVTDHPGVYGNDKKGWINNVNFMPEDDDINYTIMGLKIIEKYGVNFTPEDVAEAWLDNLPILHLCTAERVAYRNLVNLMVPPRTAEYRNPYREWIGAQIRGDFYGYIAPGDPQLSSAMAFRDASISHTKNGIYGEMFIAAMLSAAAVTENITQIIETGLSMIPERSRLYETIQTVIEWYRQKLSWEEAIDRIHQRYDEMNAHHWCHTISNAMIVCVGLLYGEKDFTKSIGIAVMAGFDTDCNGATVGSILGMVLGAEALPKEWINPLNNQVKSGIDGFQITAISELAERTVAQIQG